MTHDHLPTASLAALQFRARCLQAARRFFDTQGYWEVDTPLLSRDIVIDAYLEPFLVPDTHAGQPFYLQTSPEAGMKRLLAAGADAIYQLGHVFRRGERGTRHNPEFTMLEWYRTGDDHHRQMHVVETLIRTLTTELKAEKNLPLPSQPFLRTTYRQAFQTHLHIDVATCSNEDLRNLTLQQGISPPASLNLDDRDGWLNLLLALCIEPHLGRHAPEFLHDYPASQSALARIRHEEFPVAERFELYIHGIELCNGYHELLDATELQRRYAELSILREKEGAPPLPRDSRLIQAMQAGLPPSSGVALGFDRLTMLLGGYSSIQDVIPFPIERA